MRSSGSPGPGASASSASASPATTTGPRPSLNLAVEAPIAGLLLGTADGGAAAARMHAELEAAGVVPGAVPPGLLALAWDLHLARGVRLAGADASVGPRPPADRTGPDRSVLRRFAAWAGTDTDGVERVLVPACGAGRLLLVFGDRAAAHNIQAVRARPRPPGRPLRGGPCRARVRGPARLCRPGRAPARRRRPLQRPARATHPGGRPRPAPAGRLAVPLRRRRPLRPRPDRRPGRPADPADGRAAVYRGPVRDSRRRDGPGPAARRGRGPPSGAGRTRARPLPGRPRTASRPPPPSGGGSRRGPMC